MAYRETFRNLTHEQRVRAFRRAEARLSAFDQDQLDQQYKHVKRQLKARRLDRGGAKVGFGPVRWLEVLGPLAIYLLENDYYDTS